MAKIKGSKLVIIYLYVTHRSDLNELVVKTWLPGYNISFFQYETKLSFFPLPKSLLACLPKKKINYIMLRNKDSCSYKYYPLLAYSVKFTITKEQKVKERKKKKYIYIYIYMYISCTERKNV